MLASGTFVALATTLGAVHFRHAMRIRAEEVVPPFPAGTFGERHIVIDQFGYRPGDPKVAVIRSPVLGYDRNDTYAPGTRFAVRRLDTGQDVFTGTAVPWLGGLVQASSGDRGWWFDFSPVQAAGRYQIIDIERNARSAPFDIGPDVYRKVLRAALRVYYYQRSGLAKREPFADPCWTDDAAYLGPDQDGEAHDVTDRANAAKVRDMRGGWFDAGDTNKYVTNVPSTVHQLLDAFEDAPAAFADNLGIPESGNGVPDLLNEVRWETDWVKRMQLPSGGLALKVGAIKDTHGTVPSRDTSERFYVPECTSATIAGAAVMAHAAYVFRSHHGLQAEAADLQVRSIRAWDRFMAAPELETDCDHGEVRAGKADWSAQEQRGAAVEAAIYLFALTGDTAYARHVVAHYREMQPYQDIGWGRYREDQGHALLLFTRLRGAPAALRQTILSDLQDEVAAGHGIFGFQPEDDLYRSFLQDPQYHWGSLQPRANYGNVNLLAERYSATSRVSAASLRQRALETLHYFHGVNPFGMVMLSNMHALGASRSVDSLWHTWFAPGTRWNSVSSASCGPPPGYVTGGANAHVIADGVPASDRPPAGQPAQKSFRVSNDWRMAAWTYNEPAIYYQSAYIELLSEFAQ